MHVCVCVCGCIGPSVPWAFVTGLLNWVSRGGGLVKQGLNGRLQGERSCRSLLNIYAFANSTSASWPLEVNREKSSTLMKRTIEISKRSTQNLRVVEKKQWQSHICAKLGWDNCLLSVASYDWVDILLPSKSSPVCLFSPLLSAADHMRVAWKSSVKLWKRYDISTLLYENGNETDRECDWWETRSQFSRSHNSQPVMKTLPPKGQSFLVFPLNWEEIQHLFCSLLNLVKVWWVKFYSAFMFTVTFAKKKENFEVLMLQMQMIQILMDDEAFFGCVTSCIPQVEDLIKYLSIDHTTAVKLYISISINYLSTA